MSPEQILGHAIDTRTDLYSLGVIFFELLTGSCPFSGNFAALLEQHVNLAPPELPPALAAEAPRVAEIVCALLSKDPEKRFRTAKELAAAIEEASQSVRAASVVPAGLARAADRRAAGTVVAARQFGRRTMKFGRRLAAATRVTWSKSVRYCHARWRRLARGWRLALGSIAALGLIILLVVMVWSGQGVGHTEESGPDQAGAKRPLPQPVKTGTSKSRR
jgi:hypothetical protein